MLKAGRLALSEPSVTVMTRPENVPGVVGVPLMLPVLAFNDAHVGKPCTLKVRVSPLVSAATGVNEYRVPAVPVLDGTPVIVGATFGAADTVMVKASSATAAALPSDTLMTMLGNVPARELPASAHSFPVLVSKAAHAGLP